MAEGFGQRIWHVFAALVLLAALNPSPSPGILRESLQQAAQAQQGGRPQAALIALQPALALEPLDPALHWQAADLASASDDLDSVVRHLNVFEALVGVTGPSRCLRGDVLLKQGDAAGAIALWRGAPTACPDYESHYRNLASAYLALDDPTGYEQALASLASVTPQDGATLRALALTIAARAPDQAEAALRAADRAGPQGDPLMRALIRTIGEARLEDDPAYSLAQVGQTMAQANEWRYASWAFKNALALEPDYVEARAYLGLSLDRTGRDGLAELEAATAAAPDAAQPHAFLGMHWRMNGQIPQALNELQAAAKLAPSDPAIAAELAATYEASGDLQSALAAYRIATDLAPQQSGFWYLLAAFSIRNELHIEAIALPAARNATALAPDDPAAWDSLGYCYLLSGDTDMADRMLARSMALDPARPPTLYHLGLLRLYQGDLAAARAALQSAIRADPGGSIADLAQRALDRVGS